MKKSESRKLILASSSPRRKAILEKAGLSFSIIPSEFDETLESDVFLCEQIENLAIEKARFFSQKQTAPCLVIGADTVVVLDNKILGKPADYNEAKKILTDLSGKKHFVVTSVCIIENNTGKTLVESVFSNVEFQDLSEDKIAQYILEFKPLDKAGAYGIQELPDGFVKSVDGSFENIVGLCPKTVLEMLREFDFVI